MILIVGVKQNDIYGFTDQECPHRFEVIYEWWSLSPECLRHRYMEEWNGTLPKETITALVTHQPGKRCVGQRPVH